MEVCGTPFDENDDVSDTESYMEVDSDQEDYSTPPACSFSHTPSLTISECTSTPDDDNDNDDKDDYNDDEEVCVVALVAIAREELWAFSSVCLDYYEGKCDDDPFGRLFVEEERALRKETKEVLSDADSMCLGVGLGATIQGLSVEEAADRFIRVRGGGFSSPTPTGQNMQQCKGRAKRQRRCSMRSGGVSRGGYVTRADTRRYWRSQSAVVR